MKSLHNTLAESLLDADFDVKVISLEEIVDKALETKFNKTSWKVFVSEVENSFKPATKTDYAQDYFGTIEMVSFPGEFIVRINFDPDRSRGLGSTRHSIEVSYRHTETDKNTSHWLMPPAFEIPDTPANRKYLNQLYKELDG